jgi:serine/threonine-protein kinase RsbW
MYLTLTIHTNIGLGEYNSIAMEKAFPRDYSSLDHIFGFITEVASDRTVDEKTMFSIKLATEELFTNMVKYNTGTGNEITIRIKIDKKAVTVELVDVDVDPFDPNTAVEAGVDGAVEDRQIGGLGLRLVRSVVDKLSYEYSNRKMTVTLSKQLEQR